MYNNKRILKKKTILYVCVGFVLAGRVGSYSPSGHPSPGLAVYVVKLRELVARARNI